MENQTTIDSICNGKPHHFDLAGQGTITMVQRCQIQLDDRVIQSGYETKTDLSQSYLPSMNMTHIFNQHGQSKNLKIIREKTSQPNPVNSKYDTELEELQSKMHQIADQANKHKWHNIHHYTTTYTYAIICIVIGAYLIYKKRSKPKNADTEEIQRNINEQIATIMTNRRSHTPIEN